MISIAPYQPADEAGIRAFNARLAAASAGFQFPVAPGSLDIPTAPGAALSTDVWVARDGDRVCGGFLLKHERLLLKHDAISVGNYQLPLSEGIIDRRYATVGVGLTNRAIAAMPALYSLGMGSLARPLPRLLARLGWTVEEVPFYFRIVHGGRVAANLRVLQSTPGRRRLLQGLGMSGAASLGAFGWRLAAAVATLPMRVHRPLKLVAVDRFDERVDTVFAANRDAYPAVLDRGFEALKLRFPARDARLRRFMIDARGRSVGWLVLTVNDVRDHKQFGDLRLGCIVDGLIDPAWVTPAVALATRELIDAGADLVVSNQSHGLWRRALRRSLYLRGPSNFILARSRAFAPDVPLAALHMNRGDGDGPINL